MAKFARGVSIFSRDFAIFEREVLFLISIFFYLKRNLAPLAEILCMPLFTLHHFRSSSLGITHVITIAGHIMFKSSIYIFQSKDMLADSVLFHIRDP